MFWWEPALYIWLSCSGCPRGGDILLARAVDHWLCWSKDALVTRGANDTCLVTWVQITQRGEQGGGRLPLPQLYNTQLAVDLEGSYSWLSRYWQFLVFVRSGEGGCNLWWWAMRQSLGFLFFEDFSHLGRLRGTSLTPLALASAANNNWWPRPAHSRGSTSNSISIPLSISDPDYSSFPSPGEQNMNREGQIRDWTSFF